MCAIFNVYERMYPQQKQRKTNDFNRSSCNLEKLKMLTEPFSKLFLCNFNDAVKIEDLPSDELQQMWRCEWSAEYLSSIVDSYLNELPHNIDDSKGAQLLSQAIEITLIFVQHNFTGPFEQLQEFNELLLKKLPQDFEAGRKLMENGEEINPNVQLGALLIMAKEIMRRLLEKWPDSWVLHWWHLRLICVHQNIFDELTSNLFEQLKLVSEWLLQHVQLLADKELESMLFLELANGFLLFHRTQKSEQLLDDLCKRLNVELNVEGLLGVRTKFQQKPLPQLCLKVTSEAASDLPAASATNGSTNIPKLLLLDDDTRLERISFIEAKDNEIMTLPSVLQALVLAKVKQLKRSQPKHRLAEEELEPYIQTLLYQQHGPLQVRQSSLLLNCVQESGARRTVERSWKQCEEALKLLNDKHYTLKERLSYAFASFLQPKWQVQLQLCDLQVSLGMTKSALDIYLQLQAWEQVIECYTRLELRHKAAEIIRQELAKKPSVLLHCLLGDAVDDPKCYETAWEFSKHSSGRAQAHWGSYYFRRKEYELAIPHLEKSVEINSLQEKIWLRLGYAAITLEKWALAVHAYITYTHLEPLGFESWNNLAKALIKLGDKKRAHKVLGEALKCNFTNWKVWENFMVASVDTCNFEDAINAYNRLSELKERYFDLEVLCVLITAIANGTPDAKGQSPERLRKKATTLLGHQCVRHGNEHRLWELAALIALTPLNKAQKLVKAYRAFTNKDLAWASKEPTSLKALQICQELCTQSLAAIDKHEDDEKSSITSQLSSARLTAQACVKGVDKESEKWEENQQLVNEINTLVEQLTEHLKQRMGSR